MAAASSDIATIYDGWAKVNARLRSVVAHPLGVPLVLLLDFLAKNGSEAAHVGKQAQRVDVRVEAEFRAYLRTFGPAALGHRVIMDQISRAVYARDKLSTEVAAVLQLWFSDEDTNEHALTNALWVAFEKSPLVQKKAEVNAVGPGWKRGRTEQIRIKDRQDSGKYDLLLSSFETKAPIALFECGLKNELWWAKASQALRYITILSNKDLVAISSKNKVVVKRFAKYPMLMSAFTVDKKSCDFKVAVFLCWHEASLGRDEVDPAISMALLWKAQSDEDESIEQRKISFSRALSNIVSVAMWMEGESSGDTRTDTFSLLGPNCSKIEESVRTSVFSWTNIHCTAIHLIFEYIPFDCRKMALGFSEAMTIVSAQLSGNPMCTWITSAKENLCCTSAIHLQIRHGPLASSQKQRMILKTIEWIGFGAMAVNCK
jgi:hypothetical protein